jgi:ferredoxin
MPGKGQFQPAVGVEGAVSMDARGKTVEIRGVVTNANRSDYLKAWENPAYAQAVDQAQRESHGMQAVLSKAVVCDLCESVDGEAGATPRCVYACPHDAAFRVDADQFFRAAAPAADATKNVGAGE